ncbi:ABC transporter permease [Cellulomonas sp. Sa3CUA2]|uniref:ABC transporter permease n=1 Tax=Cellulomonas avistercoris TaxID=2762242 RepID=A0ABR8QEU9_9CELL|nr:ABC transporter permease [Cellulomonas avistercoris]MBD7918957.1 ABC transporter permease [Cellulomonas avistercoris]
MSASTVTVPAVGAPARDRTDRTGWWKVVPFVVIALVAVVGPFLLPYDPTRVVASASVPPGGDHWFGTDSAGLDVFSRVVAATRLNLLIAGLVTVLATLIGALVGILIGMNESRRGPLGLAARGLSRLVDLADAVPAIVLGLVVISFFGATAPTIVVCLAVILSPIQIRLIRTEVLRVRAEAYLDAARIAGVGEARLTFRHVMPNSVSAAWENTSVVFAVSIIVTAALGFVGVGMPPPTPEWGAMLSRGAPDAVAGRWWSATFPAAALALAVGAFALAASEVLRRRRR